MCSVVIAGGSYLILADGPPLPLPEPYTITTSSLPGAKDGVKYVDDTLLSRKSDTITTVIPFSYESNPPSSENETSSTPSSEATKNENQSGKININSAPAKTLTQLSGIGDVLAGRIVEYRTKFGAFNSIDELKNVEGIGEKKFASISDNIIV